MNWFDTISNLLYVITGFALAAGWESYRDIRNRREEAKNIRQILAEEIRYNKAVLKEFVTHVRAEERRYKIADRDNYGGITTDADPWQDLISFVPDRLSVDAWNSQLAKIPSTMTDNEMAKLFDFYRNLAEISSLHKRYISTSSTHKFAGDSLFQKIISLMEEVVARPLSIIR